MPALEIRRDRTPVMLGKLASRRRATRASASALASRWYQRMESPALLSWIVGIEAVGALAFRPLDLSFPEVWLDRPTTQRVISS
jgi:hypothetical protein